MNACGYVFWELELASGLEQSSPSPSSFPAGVSAPPVQALSAVSWSK